MIASKAETSSLLTSRGIKPTSSRLAVAQVLLATQKPLSVKDIFSKLLAADVDIGIATVYRVMGLFKDAGIVKHWPGMSDKNSQYQLAASKSGQVVCSTCGKVEEIDELPEFDELRKVISSHSSFAAGDQQLYIVADCRNEECD